MAKLNSRQWNLYNAIKEASEHNTTLTVAEICSMFPFDYFLNAKECNNSNCPTLYKDIEEINSNGKIEKLIVTDRNNIHLANEVEMNEELEKTNRKLKIYGKRKKIILKKLRNNGQMKCLSNDDKPITESKGRPFVESWLGGK